MNEQDIDAFLSHNSEDKATARELKRVFEARKLTVWFDEDQLRPGVNWQPLLEQGLERAGSVIVALGGSGMARWQSQETQVATVRTRYSDR
jgi:TIR domain